MNKKTRKLFSLLLGAVFLAGAGLHRQRKSLLRQVYLLIFSLWEGIMEVARLTTEDVSGILRALAHLRPGRH